MTEINGEVLTGSEQVTLCETCDDMTVCTWVGPPDEGFWQCDGCD